MTEENFKRKFGENFMKLLELLEGLKKVWRNFKKVRKILGSKLWEILGNFNSVSGEFRELLRILFGNLKEKLIKSEKKDCM